MANMTDLEQETMQPGAQIKLTFHVKTGEMHVQAQGFKGSSCQHATEYLKSLGNVTDFAKKQEWFETNIRIGNVLRTNLCG